MKLKPHKMKATTRRKLIPAVAALREAREKIQTILTAEEERYEEMKTAYITAEEPSDPQFDRVVETEVEIDEVQTALDYLDDVIRQLSQKSIINKIAY